MIRRIVIILAVLLIGCDSAFAAKTVAITKKNRLKLILTDARLPNKKPLVCYRAKPSAQPRPGWLKKINKQRHWTPFKKTKKNAQIYNQMLAICKDNVPEPSECKAPAGFVGISSSQTFMDISREHGKYFLCNDIELSGTMTPLLGDGIFKGVLDGNGKAIRGLHIEQPTAPAVGLFRVVQGGTIKNLRIIEPIVKGKGVVGVLAGISSGTIDKVTIETGSVEATRRPAGALVGVQFMGRISNSSANTVVTAEGQSGDQLAGVSFP